MMNIYCSNLETKSKFVFNLYDFDNDGLISKDDARTILQFIPIQTQLR